MISTLEAIYLAQKQEDGTWSVVESKTGQIADIGGCVLRGLDVAMATGLVQDLNSTETLRSETVRRSQP